MDVLKPQIVIYGERYEYAGLGILVIDPYEEDPEDLLDDIMEARSRGNKIVVENKPDVIRS